MKCTLDCLKAWFYHGSILLISNALILGFLWWVSYGNLRVEAVAAVALLVADGIYLKQVW